MIKCTLVTLYGVICAIYRKKNQNIKIKYIAILSYIAKYIKYIYKSF